MDVSEGDIVAFSKYGRAEIKVEGTDYLILRESDVLASVVGDRELEAWRTFLRARTRWR